MSLVLWKLRQGVPTSYDHVALRSYIGTEHLQTHTGASTDKTCQTFSYIAKIKCHAYKAKTSTRAASKLSRKPSRSHGDRRSDVASDYHLELLQQTQVKRAGTEEGHVLQVVDAAVRANAGQERVAVASDKVVFR